MSIPFMIGQAQIQGKTYNIGDKQRYQVNFGTLSATTIRNIKPPVGKKVTAVYLQSGNDRSASDTDYITVGIVNKSDDATGTAVIVDNTNAANSTKATGGTALTALIANTLTITSTAADLLVNPNDVLQVTITVGGTVSITDLNVYIDCIDF